MSAAAAAAVLCSSMAMARTVRFDLSACARAAAAAALNGTPCRSSLVRLALAARDEASAAAPSSPMELAPRKRD
eukprot:2119483-Pleurochrysis_carterae.AAC.1